MIRTFVVEDDPVAAAAHAQYVGRVRGFEVLAMAATGADALRALARGGVDLVEAGPAAREPRCSGTGRPQLEYRPQ